MFPEYRDLISTLKVSDLHFERLFNKHNELDQKIKNMGANASDIEIENLKKEKLKLKDQIHAVLLKEKSPT